MARRAAYYDRDWCLGIFDGPELVAGLVVLPFGYYVNGAQIPLGGVASVSCLPERRREGFVGALLRHTLAAMREAGQPLSGLYTPHYSLYRGYGWEIANRIVSYAFSPKTTALRLPVPPGRYRRVGAGDWRELDAIYTAYAASSNGGLVRPERWWRNNVLRHYGREERDAVVWSNAAGEPRGYAVYRSSHQSVPGSPFGETTLRVVDWVVLDAKAYMAILGYLRGHDLSTRIVMLASQDEPFADAFEEPMHIAEPPGAWFGMMLRLVDVQQALEARPALPQASGRGVTIAVSDDAAPWNAGTWRVECSEGRISAEPTEAAPEIEMDVRALAPLYNGFTKPADAVRVGQVRAHSRAAVEAATDIFATSFAPFCPDDF